MAYVFLLPNLVFFGLFVFLPIAINFVLFGHRRARAVPVRTPVCGRRPIRLPVRLRLLSRSGDLPRGPFLARRANTLKFAVFQVVAMVLFSLITALVLNMKIRGRGLLPRRLFLPGAAVAGGRRADLEMDSAARRAAQCRHHLARRRQDPVLRRSRLGDVLGGLRLGLGAYGLLHADPARRPAGDPADLYEAAEMDATPRWRVFWRITLPLLWPNLIVVIVLALIRAVQTFDEVFVLTGGGPGTAHADGRAVHLRDGLRQPGAELRPGGGRLGRARRRAVRPDAGAARLSRDARGWRPP